jgi:hypothetical protein
MAIDNLVHPQKGTDNETWKLGQYGIAKTPARAFDQLSTLVHKKLRREKSQKNENRVIIATLSINGGDVNLWIQTVP